MKSLTQSLLIFSAMIVLLESCGKADAQKGEAQAPDPAVRVKVVSLENAEQALPITTSGTLKDKTEINLSFKVGGIIQGIYVNESQSVRKGQILAKLEQTEINAKVNQAQQALEKAKRDLQRAKNLYQDTVATLEQLQNARTAQEVAEADLRIAQYNQKYSVIYAPTPGKILRKMAENQELIEPGKSVLRLGSTAQAKIIKVGLADREVIKLRLGDQANIRFDAYEGEVFKAKVTEIAESANSATGTYEVELALEPTSKILKNGFVGKVEIFPSQAGAYYRVPLGALVEADGNQAYLYTPHDQEKTARKLNVRVQYMGADFFTVAQQDLEGVTHVITEGAPYLSEGTKIRF